jgi:hypothetical protein
VVAFGCVVALGQEAYPPRYVETLERAAELFAIEHEQRHPQPMALCVECVVLREIAHFHQHGRGSSF